VWFLEISTDYFDFPLRKLSLNKISQIHNAADCWKFKQSNQESLSYLSNLAITLNYQAEAVTDCLGYKVNLILLFFAFDN